jgi:ferric-dicitrate binding protein FerR (iron transport regulator)
MGLSENLKRELERYREDAAEAHRRREQSPWTRRRPGLEAGIAVLFVVGVVLGLIALFSLGGQSIL